MKGLFPDWRAKGVTACLHEHQGGFAFNQDSVDGLHRKALEAGVGSCGCRGDGLRGRLRRLDRRGRDLGGPRRGRRAARHRAGAVGQAFWRCSAFRTRSTCARPSGDVVRDRPMWTYWNLQEGEIAVDPLIFATADGGPPPVIHLDTDAPLTPTTASSSPTSCGGSTSSATATAVQGGASPLVVDGEVELDPYPSTTDVDPDFPDMWCAALSHAMCRFEGCRAALQAGALGRRRRVHGRQLPGLRLPEAERVRGLRLQPRLQDDRRRAGGREGARSASTRACSTRSGTSASRPATSTPSRRPLSLVVAGAAAASALGVAAAARRSRRVLVILLLGFAPSSSGSRWQSRST